MSARAFPSPAGCHPLQSWVSFIQFRAGAWSFSTCGTCSCHGSPAGKPERERVGTKDTALCGNGVCNHLTQTGFATVLSTCVGLKELCSLEIHVLILIHLETAVQYYRCVIFQTEGSASSRKPPWDTPHQQKTTLLSVLLPTPAFIWSESLYNAYFHHSEQPPLTGPSHLGHLAKCSSLISCFVICLLQKTLPANLGWMNVRLDRPTGPSAPASAASSMRTGHLPWLSSQVPSSASGTCKAPQMQPNEWREGQHRRP